MSDVGGRGDSCGQLCQVHHAASRFQFSGRLQPPAHGDLVDDIALDVPDVYDGLVDQAVRLVVEVVSPARSTIFSRVASE